MQKNEITHIRILATFLVVLGHSMIIYDPNWTTFTSTYSSNFFFILKQFINIIQMPLFFIISGYLFSYTIKKDKYKCFSDLFKDKFKRLCVPFLFVCSFWLVPIRLYINYSPYTKIGYLKSLVHAFIGIDSGHLWFLPTLFFIFCIAYFICKNQSKKYSCFLLVLLVMLHFASFLLPSVAFIGYVSKYLIYFYCGYYWANENIKFKYSLPIIMTSFAFVIFSLLLSIYANSKILLVVQAFLDLMSSVGITYTLFRLFKTLQVGKVEQFFNKNSFAIYLFHSPVIYICYYYFCNLCPFILVPLNVCISVSISLLMATIIRMLGINWLIGEK